MSDEKWKQLLSAHEAAKEAYDKVVDKINKLDGEIQLMLPGAEMDKAKVKLTALAADLGRANRIEETAKKKLEAYEAGQ